MLLTVYTPTYNRSRLLKNLYHSLCNQRCLDFCWLVVDDGSTDDTKELVQKWIDEKKILVEYLYKENGGVHTARDAAYHYVKSDLIFGIDSDDEALPNMVETILKTWNDYARNDVCGIITPVCSNKGVGLDPNFPNVNCATYQELTYKYKCVGDHSIILRTDVVKSIPDVPVFKNEKLLSESYKWIQLPNKPFIIIQDYTVIHNYLEDGYTQNLRRNWFANLNGYRALYSQRMKSCVFLKPKLESAIKYIIASLFLCDKRFLFKTSNPLMICMCLPFGFLFYLIFKIKWKRSC